MNVLKKLLPFTVTILLSLVLVAYYPGWRDSVSWHVQRELCKAAGDGRLREVKFLDVLGANLEGWNTSYEPIQYAAAGGRTEVVVYLLAQGVDINSRDKLGYTPLMQATNYGRVGTIRLLLSKGVDIDIHRRGGNADINAVGDDGTALDLAIANNSPEIIKLLKSSGAKTSKAILFCNQLGLCE